MYEYRTNLIKVVDGDTVDVDIDLGFGIWLRNERVRIMGIDTPESRTSDTVEKLFGKAASKRLKELLGKSPTLRTRCFRWCRYERQVWSYPWRLRCILSNN